MKNKLFASIAIATLALAGCSDSTGNSDETTSAGGTAGTSETTSDGTNSEGASLHGTYNSIDELQTAAEEAGYECATPEELGWNQVSCDGVDVLGVFANPGSASAYVHQAEASAEEAFTALVGDNWVVIGDEDALTDLQSELGGEIQNFDAA